MKSLHTIIALCLALNLIRCATGNLAGATSETTNGTVVIAAGTPVAGARVKIVSDDFWYDRNMVLDSTRTDSLGRFTLPRRTWGKRVNLQIDHAEGALFLRSFVGEESGTFILQKHGKYGGLVKNGPQRAQKALLVGTAYRTEVDSRGLYEFGPIAPGTYPMLFEILEEPSTSYAFNTTLDLKAGDSLADSMVNADPAIVPLDRFDAGFGLTTLGHFVDAICWYYYTDSLTRSYDPATDSWRFYSLIPDEQRGNSFMDVASIPDDNIGKKIVATIVLGDKALYPYAGLGVILASDYSKVPMNLSAMTALRLKAFGRGAVQIRLESPIIDSLAGNHQYTYILHLPQTEQMIVMPVDSLFLYPPNAAIQAEYPWSRIAKSIDRIEFEFSFSNNAIGDTLSFTCDDIVFEGARLEEIFIR